MTPLCESCGTPATWRHLLPEGGQMYLCDDDAALVDLSDLEDLAFPQSIEVPF